MATTNITLAIDNTILSEAVGALCKHGGYQAQIPDPTNPSRTIANPVTKAQFAKKVVAGLVRNIVVEQRNRALLETDNSVSEALIS